VPWAGAGVWARATAADAHRPSATRNVFFIASLSP